MRSSCGARSLSSAVIQLSHDDVAEDRNNPYGPRQSHVRIQALGSSPSPVAIEPHVSVNSPLAPGETLLLCSDGVSDMVPIRPSAATLRPATDLLQAARRLAARAFSGGARDNVSLSVARLSAGSDERRSPRTVRAATD